MVNFENCLFDGIVSHQRTYPLNHKFNYKITYFWIDINQEPKLNFLKFNKPWLFSFFEKDFGNPKRKKEVTLYSHIKKELEKKKIYDVQHIKVLCLPRFLNYVFNPISVFVCFNKKNLANAILFEVRNTFGEKHIYYSKIFKGEQRFFTKKKFHVSPFFKVRGWYEIKFSISKKNVNLEIIYSSKKKKIFFASFHGDKKNLDNRNLLKLTVLKFFQNIKVVIGIHIEALKLWMKGAIYIKKPKPSKNIFTYIKK